MALRRTPGLLLALLILSSVACSKTQDTAPERRVFGDPPVIEFATMTPADRTVTCDWTDVFNCSQRSQACDWDPDGGAGPDHMICGPGFPSCLENKSRCGICSMPGGFFPPIGCDDDCGRGTPESDPGNPVRVTPGPLVITGTYQELFFQAKVTDPNSTPQRNDILLVSASYVVPGGSNPEESTLIMLDDGGQNSFMYSQTGGLGLLEDCTVFSDQTCSCRSATYGLNSNDTTPSDNLWERRFGLFNLPDQNVRGLMSDCIASKNHQAPATVAANVSFDFRIDAVDRSGNITTSPTRPRISTTRNTYTCEGDQCLCCILRSNIGDCGGCSGLVGPKTPEGACRNEQLGCLLGFDANGTCPIQ